jgi:hypothetical protein
MNIYIVTLVKRGFIQEPELFNNENDAEKRKKKLMKNFNPDYDEIEVFHKRINLVF